MDFVHLHVQSAYSLLNSTVKIDELVSKVKNSGMHSIALADRNVMYGAIPFYKECKKNKIKPIIGLLADVLHGEEAYPLLLLARNNQGYSNLLKISSSIQIMSKNGIPLKWLKGYRDGLIAITPGDEGIIESLVKQGEIDRALDELQNLKSILKFIDDFLNLNILNNVGLQTLQVYKATYSEINGMNNYLMPLVQLAIRAAYINN